MAEHYPANNVRHEIDALLVCQQIERACLRYQKDCDERSSNAANNVRQYHEDVANGLAHKWMCEPDKPEEIVSIYQNWIQREKLHYAKVRVIELPQPGERYVLVYGDESDVSVKDGTGPFETLEEAAQWFLRGGR